MATLFKEGLYGCLKKVYMATLFKEGLYGYPV